MNNEWINVTPGKRPDLAATFKIKIRQRNGNESVHPVGFVSFNHSGGPEDVVAYTVAERPIVERDITIKTPDLRLSLLEAELNDCAAILAEAHLRIKRLDKTGDAESILSEIRERMEAVDMLVGEKEIGVSELLVSCPHCLYVHNALGDK